MAWFGARKQGNIAQFSAVDLPVNYIEENGSVVAYSPVLDLSSCGTTRAEAQKMFREAVTIFFRDLIENNMVDEVLESLGWRKVRHSWSPPRTTQESVRVDVPVAA